MVDNLADIRRFITGKQTATWGRSFDVTTNLDEAAKWFDEQMDAYFQMLDDEAPNTIEVEITGFWDNELTKAAERAISQLGDFHD